MIQLPRACGGRYPVLTELCRAKPCQGISILSILLDEQIEPAHLHPPTPPVVLRLLFRRESLPRLNHFSEDPSLLELLLGPRGDSAVPGSRRAHAVYSDDRDRDDGGIPSWEESNMTVCGI